MEGEEEGDKKGARFRRNWKMKKEEWKWKEEEEEGGGGDN
jgi:hypothetical protein